MISASCPIRSAARKSPGKSSVGACCSSSGTGNRVPQIILKTDERKYYAGTRPRGKFAAKSTAWDEIEDDKLEVAVKNGRWVVTHLPAGPARLSGRYSTTSVPKNDAVTAPAVAPQRRCDGATVAQQPRCDGATERFRRCGRDRQSRSAIACRSPSLK